ncbi:MAG: uroporphyrinogen-III synthase [Pseudomonadota bacterium]
MAKILLTRPQKLSENIAKNLSKKNLSSLIEPLFSIAPIDNLQPITEKLQAILITSSAAVFALEKLALEKDLLILAIGEKTADKIKKLGYQNILIANNSAASLLNLALEKLSKSNGLILYLSGEIITLDLAEKLQEQNFSAQKIVVYKTTPSQKFSTPTIDKIKNGEVGEVWIYSKNSLKIFHQLAAQDNLLEYLREIKILCLTKEIADLADKMNFLKTGIIQK